jgi:hypothetical protein
MSLPQNDINGDDSPKSQMSIAQIKYTFDELRHQLVHLERSQIEIFAYLQENEDPDISNAFWENNEIIRRRKDKLKELIEDLKDFDPVYYRQIRSFLEEAVEEFTLSSQLSSNIDEILPSSSLPVVDPNPIEVAATEQQQLLEEQQQEEEEETKGDRTVEDLEEDDDEEDGSQFIRSTGSNRNQGIYL